MSSAITACPPSWAIVISPLDTCQGIRNETITSAARAETATTQGSGSG
ncbi:hypothetical protein ACWEPC_51460 [Nonomuraea sp. NPDC004297]